MSENELYDSSNDKHDTLKLDALRDSQRVSTLYGEPLHSERDRGCRDCGHLQIVHERYCGCRLCVCSNTFDRNNKKKWKWINYKS